MPKLTTRKVESLKKPGMHGDGEGLYLCVGATGLGFYPQDNTEPYRAAMNARVPRPNPKSPSAKALGGGFVVAGHPDDRAAR